MNNFIINSINKYGYIAILGLILFENIFPPIPSEIILSFSGFITRYSNLNIFIVILSSCIGSIIGAIILYLIGYLLNYNFKKINITKLFNKLKFKQNNIDKAKNWFNNKGEYTVFFCRFIPIVRSLISIPAGMNKMNFLKFLIYTFYGSLIWNSIIVFIGRALGNSYPIISKYIKIYSKIILFIFILFLLSILIYKKTKKHK